MRLDSMRQMFIGLAGAEPRGWDDLWEPFVAVIREPVEEPDILRDDIWVEIVPPHPHDSPHPYVVLSRKIGIRGGDTDNNLEAQLAVSAAWTSVDVGDEITTMTARGPSSYEGAADQPVDALVAQVAQHPVIAALRAADDEFDRWVAEYLPPEELD